MLQQKTGASSGLAAGCVASRYVNAPKAGSARPAVWFFLLRGFGRELRHEKTPAILVEQKRL
jgi:hypothetical protein